MSEMQRTSLRIADKKAASIKNCWRRFLEAVKAGRSIGLETLVYADQEILENVDPDSKEFEVFVQTKLRF